MPLSSPAIAQQHFGALAFGNKEFDWLSGKVPPVKTKVQVGFRVAICFYALSWTQMVLLLDLLYEYEKRFYFYVDDQGQIHMDHRHCNGGHSFLGYTSDSRIMCSECGIINPFV